jgi:hypothetical protein
MSLGLAQQVGINNDGQNSKNKQLATHAIIFVYFPDFPPVVAFLQLFIFSTIFLYFSPNREHTGWKHKSFNLNRVKLWSTENQARSLKTVQQLWSLRSPT